MSKGYVSYLGHGSICLARCGLQDEVGDLAIRMVVLHFTTALVRPPCKESYPSFYTKLEIRQLAMVTIHVSLFISEDWAEAICK